MHASKTGILVVIALGMSCMAPVARACTAADVPQIVKTIADADIVTNGSDALHCLVDNGPLAAKLLIQDLHPMPEAKILNLEIKQHKDSMHVIWCMRTLRSLTGGLEFTAGSAAEIRKRHLPENQEYWILRGSGDAVRMYGDWMSRDSVYIAPKDIQEAVIAKWKDWYAANGATFHYVYDTNIDDWYF